MNDKIGELAKQVSKLKDAASSVADVISITIQRDFKTLKFVAEVHISEPIDGMGPSEEFVEDLLRKSVSIDGVDIFCLIDKEEAHGL